MPEIPRFERKTQNRFIALFIDKDRHDCLSYRYLGEWHKQERTRARNQAIMQELLTGRTRLV